MTITLSSKVYLNNLASVSNRLAPSTHVISERSTNSQGYSIIAIRIPRRALEAMSVMEGKDMRVICDEGYPDLRKQVLERDNFMCRRCVYR